MIDTFCAQHPALGYSCRHGQSTAMLSRKGQRARHRLFRKRGDTSLCFKAWLDVQIGDGRRAGR